MDEEKKCQICGAPAVVHITQILNNKSTKTDLCESCAQKNGYLSSSGLPFSMLASLGESLFNGLKSTSIKIGNCVCKTCGCSPEIFKKNGRLGCKDCYTNLSHMIDYIISNTQRNNKHAGKHPMMSMPTNMQLENKAITNKDKYILENLLHQAVAEERFEDAAKIRDEIKKLKNLQ